MKTINTLKAISSGAIVIAKLANPDQYLLVLAGKDKICDVPMIRVKSSAFAYIDPDKYGIEEYDLLSRAIDNIVGTGAYKEISGFKPISRRAPEHASEVVGFAKPCNGAPAVTPKNIGELLSKCGYTYKKKELTTKFVKRDYGELLKDPANQKIYEEDEAELRKVGATYEGLPGEMKIAYEAVENGTANGIIFEGPTGTGKSFAARIMAHKSGAPLLNLQITYGTSVEDLVGMYVPNDEQEGGKWKFVEGPLLKAFYKGYQLVIEEINYGQPGVNAKLNEFTDGTQRVTVNGKVYNKHPNFVVYMTMNPGYEGTETLNVALKNRFPKVDVPALTKAEFTKRARGYSKGLGHELSAEFFDKLFDFSQVIEKEAATSKWHENVKFSIRNAQRLCENILQKQRNLAEFTDAISIQYLNDLSTDNDNSEKLEDFKNSKEIKEQIKQIYDLYDFAEEKVVDLSVDFDDLFSTTDDPDPKDGSAADKEEAMAKILDRFS